jgi:outer membrane protein OmpA-like peptidoglycan-associated protein
MANNTFTDRDKDGVPDKDDLCPDIKGLAMYLGCPERDKKSSSESTPVTASIQPNASAAHHSGTNLAIQDGRPQTISVEDLGQSSLDALKAGQSNFRQEVDAADLQYLATAMNNVYFEYGSKEITKSSYAVLDTVAMILEKYPEYSLHVQGHTDNVGTPMANQILSVKRAFQVKYYLVYDKGIRLSRISSEGYNSTNPIANNDTEEGRSMNRRVEFKLLKDATAVDYPN